MELLGPFTVSDLTKLIKKSLEEAFFGLTVEGEISNFKIAPNGHWYFRLKDDKALVNAVVWRSTASQISFIPRDGQKVRVKGNVTVYEPQGTYQLSIYSMEEYGDGDILAKLEMRKKKYAELGFFDEAIKKPIPKNPAKVAVITSPTGAAIQDILQITGRRNPNMDIIILPALVQGDEAAHTIACRIYQANIYGLADVIIVGRGGGSLEDLLPFSDDEVIMAVHESEIPIISAVGHEIDWAISDFAADMRAPTPSAAAELVCQKTEDKLQRVSELKSKMYEAVIQKISQAKLQRAIYSEASIKAQVSNRIFTQRMTLESKTETMKNSLQNRINQLKSRLEIASETLKTLNPNSVLSRGFAIVTDETGKTLNAGSAKSGSKIKLKFYDGNAKGVITEVEK